MAVGPARPARSAHPTGSRRPARRSVLAAAAVAAPLGLVATAGAPVARATGPTGRSTTFDLHCEVLDSGEQVTSLVIDATRRGRLLAGDALPSTFSVSVRGTNPVSGAVVVDTERTVTAVTVDRAGTVTITLEHGYGVEGASTLDYLADEGRNVQLDLEYTVLQHSPLPANGKGAGSAWLGELTQGDLVSPEVDAFTSHVTDSGMNYRLFSPATRGRSRALPLVIWLHGGGEGGIGEGGAVRYDNEVHLRANRGALGPATAEAQEILGGAHVVAPQCTSAWMLDGPAFAPLVSEVIAEVQRTRRVDPDRIHVMGCSNGGYMTLKMVVENGGEFASAVPICGVVDTFYGSTDPLVSDAELAAIRTPTWLIAAADDTTVDPQANTVHAHELIEDSLLSLYDDVTYDGVSYPGHWSWIYAARNDPRAEGESLWGWMAAQHR